MRRTIGVGEAGYWRSTFERIRESTDFAYQCIHNNKNAEQATEKSGSSRGEGGGGGRAGMSCSVIDRDDGVTNTGKKPSPTRNCIFSSILTLLGPLAEQPQHRRPMAAANTAKLLLDDCFD
jgi:hypothetical protein